MFTGTGLVLLGWLANCFLWGFLQCDNNQRGLSRAPFACQIIIIIASSSLLFSLTWCRQFCGTSRKRNNKFRSWEKPICGWSSKCVFFSCDPRLCIKYGLAVSWICLPPLVSDPLIRTYMHTSTFRVSVVFTRHTDVVCAPLLARRSVCK